MKIAIAKLDAALDKFWIGVVLHAYHRLMSAHPARSTFPEQRCRPWSGRPAHRAEQ
uniref:Uncharacterized protein n=1 Tax=Pseudomonas putida TaxID=303 RepID=A0A336TQH4_PSEPU|nr:hypothetical protein [Pseudomonas putida]ALZ45986.1 Hypothetical protein [Pseudomonas putida]